MTSHTYSLNISALRPNTLVKKSTILRLATLVNKLNTNEMKLIRIPLLALHTSIAFCLGLVLCLIRPFHPNNAYIVGKMFAIPALWIMGVKIRKTGNLQILNSTRPVIFVANHQHNFDLAIAAYLLKPHTVTVGKSSLGKIPVFGQFYRLSGNILVDRSNPKKAIKALKEVAKKIVEKKISIWIFPEGKRNEHRPMIPFKRGAFISATDSKAAIVPIAISHYCKRTEFLNCKAFTIEVKVLDPIETNNLSTDEEKELHNHVYQKMEEALNALS